MTNMRFSQMQLPGCQATGREPKVTDLICVSAIDPLGAVGARRGACVAIRRPTHNTSVLASPGCLVSARHMCVIAIQARFLETAPRAVAKRQGAFVFQSPASGVYKSEYYTRVRYERLCVAAILFMEAIIKGPSPKPKIRNRFPNLAICSFVLRSIWGPKPG